MSQYDDIPRSRNLFCKIMQASANRVAFLPDVINVWSLNLLWAPYMRLFFSQKRDIIW